MFGALRAALLGGASVILMVSAGHAADMVEPAQAPQPAAVGMNWSGFYVGVGGGFGAVNYNAAGIIEGIGGDGIFGELTAGYDHMLTERFLLGGFIDTHLGTIGPESKGGGGQSKITNDYGFDVGARLGYLLNGSTLGYALGGYTWQQIKASGGGASSERGDVDGYMLGLGMETAITNNWSIKTEYRYGRYSGDLEGLDIKPVTHTFHIAANYRFGANGTASALASPAYDWSGFYVGASVGAGEAVYDARDGGFDLNGLTGDGIFGELNAGYDDDLGNFVAGLMVDGNYSGIKNDNLFGFGVPFLKSGLKSDYGFDILGRVGMKVNPSTLAYVLGGYSWAHFKAEVSAVGGGPSLSDSWGSSGFSVGGGLETAITNNMTLGIEYRYAQFSDKDVEFGGVPLFKVEPSSHTVRVGLKYKFN